MITPDELAALCTAAGHAAVWVRIPDGPRVTLDRVTRGEIDEDGDVVLYITGVTP